MNQDAAPSAASQAPPALRPAFDPHALTVLEARYVRRGEDGSAVEDPAELLWRVARAVASVEPKWGGDPRESAEQFYAMLARLEFLPNSPTLMNAGQEDGQLSACFVLPIADSLEAIFDTVRDAAIIHQTGGGTGFSFSRLRPRGDPLKHRGTASGPVAFMRVFDAATGAVHQGGVRRGANMGILRVDHPDILEFVDAKRADGELTNFNISVAVTEVFMKAVAEGTSYALINPRSGEPAGELDAREVCARIVDGAWETGDPGLVFIDRINDDNPTPDVGAFESTNPCGEVPLLPHESCNLGSINVGKFLSAGDLDWDRLRETIHLAVRFLDDVIEANAYPLPPITQATHLTRKIGLGIMGWADLLIELGIPYASDQALELADRLGAFLLENSRAASRALASVRGPFPAWEGSRWNVAGEEPRRNATVTTIAPTGTIAILAGCSSGIEPLYALSYSRKALGGEADLTFFHSALERIARERGFWSDALREQVVSLGRLSNGGQVPDDVRELLRTALEIPVEWHVRTQAAFQKHVENAVSKTTNLPAEATREDVSRVYRLAYDLGCKGITVFRDGCRGEQVLTVPEASSPFCSGPNCVD